MLTVDCKLSNFCLLREKLVLSHPSIQFLNWIILLSSPLVDYTHLRVLNL